MEDALPALAAKLPRLKHGFLLMLDFDGVLAPIVKRHNAAKMPARTRTLLKACSRKGTIAVISGRALSDVRKRVGIANLWYAGNHGGEWRMGKMLGREKLPRSQFAQLRTARDAFRRISARYPGTLVEYKKLTLSVHFRALQKTRIAKFKKEILRVAGKFSKSLRTVEGNEFVFNVYPRSGRTKADAVRMIKKCAPSGVLPIYIGDDTTDEDAFKAIPRGFTILVGARRSSAARYFVRTRAGVDKILSLLAHS